MPEFNYRYFLRAFITFNNGWISIDEISDAFSDRDDYQALVLGDKNTPLIAIYASREINSDTVKDGLISRLNPLKFSASIFDFRRRQPNTEVL